MGGRLSLDAAKKIAIEKIAEKVLEDDIIPMIIDSYTKVFAWGIVFLWNDERGLTRKDVKKMLFGKHQVLVDRYTNAVIFLKEPPPTNTLKPNKEQQN